MRDCYILILFLLFVSSCSVINYLEKADDSIFKHGVASGDPLSDRVIIWTRVSGVRTYKAKGIYEVALDKKFKKIVSSNKFITSREKDYTVKIDVENLLPDTRYFYRFKVNGSFSDIGRTKTAPLNATSVSLAFVSCASLEYGKFYLYKKLAKFNSIDAIIHLGDYIYEFPEKEITTLNGYRDRYSEYRSQKHLRLAHKLHPFISVWDDHEIADNAYKSGALNYKENDVNYLTRKESAKKAYFEWMPVRENKNREIYRSFNFGNLVRLILLDARLAGKSIQNASAKESTLLGSKQEKWFFRKVFESKAIWNLIGSQVMFSNLNFMPLVNNYKFNTDSWDGYLNSKKKVLNIFDFNKFKNTHIVSADTHASWFIKIPDFKKISSYEIGVPAISSSNYDEMYNLNELKIRKTNLKNANPWIKFLNLKNNGFVVLDIDQKQITTIFHLYNNKNKKSLVKFDITRN